MNPRRTALTTREKLYVQHITALGQPTFGNPTKSAEAAGYADAPNSGWRLSKRQLVKDAIAAVFDERRQFGLVTESAVINRLENLRIRAEETGDLSTAVRCVEIEAKYLGLLVDRHQFELPQERIQLDARQKESARKIAQAVLRFSLLDDPGDNSLPAGLMLPGQGETVDAAFDEQPPELTAAQQEPQTPFDDDDDDVEPLIPRSFSPDSNEESEADNGETD